MSALLIDIGNTRLKWAQTDALGVMGTVQALPHEGDPAAVLARLCADWRLRMPDRLWIAQVFGPAQQAALLDAIGPLRVPAEIVRSPAAMDGWRSAYRAPERLGVDRFLAMLGVWAARRRAFCIASAGTALTFDAVRDDGQHEGGVIAPGLAAMVQATLGNTRFFTQGIDTAYDAGLGDDSESAVRQGALHAASGLLDRLGARPGLRLLAGGDAETLQRLSKLQWELAPDAVLHGLATYARLHAK